MKFLGSDVLLKDHIYDALIIGSGAAGFNCAAHLFDKGVSNIAVATENRLSGTSRNTGSDKQTYYKLSCAGGQQDSPYDMAKTLFEGQSMDGDIALCEAAHSMQEFFHLVSIGVDFPHNKYGEYAGYKTDNDPLCRASSTGPYTSKKMTECLEKEVIARQIKILSGYRVVKLLVDKDSGRAFGIMALIAGQGFEVLFAKNIVFATGGPAGLYEPTVYPRGQFGAMGVLAREGIVFANAAEWQYGIGSTKFRWNLSGSYQQVIPRYISIDADGNEREFLCDYFSSAAKLSEAVFLKGYQWPFNPERIANGASSLIDLAIYVEKHIKGARTYLDFMNNPKGNKKIGHFSLDALGETAHDYLAASDALEETPLKRLLKLNPNAYQLYLSKGIDLSKDYLEMDVLPQHNNGGAEIDIWWKTSIKNLFAIGECAGAHGVHRPGGSALNSGQVGGLRAALFIAGQKDEGDDFFKKADFLRSAKKEIAAFEKDFDNVVFGDETNVCGLLEKVQKLNLENCSFLRRVNKISNGLSEIEALSKEKIFLRNEQMIYAFRLKEVLLSSRLLAENILFYAGLGGASRGSYIMLTSDDILAALKGAIEIDDKFRDKVILSAFDIEKQSPVIKERQVRPLPESDVWFERVWKDFNADKIFD